MSHTVNIIGDAIHLALASCAKEVSASLATKRLFNCTRQQFQNSWNADYTKYCDVLQHQPESEERFTGGCGGNSGLRQVLLALCLSWGNEEVERSSQHEGKLVLCFVLCCCCCSCCCCSCWWWWWCWCRGLWQVLLALCLSWGNEEVERSSQHEGKLVLCFVLCCCCCFCCCCCCFWWW